MTYSRRGDDLEDRVRYLETSIKSIVQEITRSFDSLQKTLEASAKATVKEIQRSAEVSGRIEIAKQIAQLNAITPIVEEQTNMLESEVKRGESYAERIVTKYDSIEGELDESYERDIRRLGAHIYDILENDYQKGIEDRYSRSSYDLASRAAIRIDIDRSESIFSHVKKAREEITKFAGKRLSFRESVANKLIEEKVPVEKKGVAIPFWIIKIKDSNGEISNTIVGPSMIVKKQGGECRYTFKRLPKKSSYSTRNDI